MHGMRGTGAAFSPGHPGSSCTASAIPEGVRLPGAGTCTEQLDELRRASRYPELRDILQPHRYLPAVSPCRWLSISL